MQTVSLNAFKIQTIRIIGCQLIRHACFHIFLLLILSESDSKPMHPQLEMTLSGFEMKTCKTELVTASSATLSSVHILVHRTGK